jgi:hypothetical protein
MNAERRAPVAYSDRERVERILELLPEAGVRHFADELLSDAQYHDHNRPIYEEFDEGMIRNKLFTFDDPDLRQRYHELSVVFAALDTFLPHHFFQTKSDVYALYPEWKKVTDPEQQRQWQEKYDELQELTLSFQAKYNAFLLQSRKTAPSMAPTVGIAAVQSDDIFPKESAENDSVITKGKVRIQLPQFPSTQWSRVFVRLVDDQTISLFDGNKREQYSYDGLGFADTRTKPVRPDASWEFLREFILNNGRISITHKIDREAEKKKKQKIKKILCIIFDNPDDPFEADGYGVYVAKFNIENFQTDGAKVEVQDIRFADLGAVREEMTAPVESERNDDFSQ